MFKRSMILMINVMTGTTTKDSAIINNKIFVPLCLFRLCIAFLAILNSPHRQNLL